MSNTVTRKLSCGPARLKGYSCSIACAYGIIHRVNLSRGDYKSWKHVVLVIVALSLSLLPSSARQQQMCPFGETLLFVDPCLGLVDTWYLTRPFTGNAMVAGRVVLVALFYPSCLCKHERPQCIPPPIIYFLLIPNNNLTRTLYHP